MSKATPNLKEVGCEERINSWANLLYDEQYIRCCDRTAVNHSPYLIIKFSDKVNADVDKQGDLG